MTDNFDTISWFKQQKGGEGMIKKATVAAGVFAMTALAAATMTFAQTPTNTTTNTTNNTTNTTTNTTVPGGAPATGR